MRTLALVVVGLLIAAGVAWVAGEAHYQSCIEAAQVRHPVPVVSASERLLGRFADIERQAQQQAVAAVDGCSRLP